MPALILSFLTLSFLWSVHACAKAPQMQIVKFQSTSNLRTTFDGYFYEAKNAKGLIVYLHGGGCRSLQAQPIHLLKTFPLNEKLFERGYSVLIANYTEKINSTWLNSSGVDYTYPDLNNEERCKLDMMAQIPLLHQSRPIVLMGHSYGGYLVNYLASDTVQVSNVAAFVSYAGIWDPFLRNQWSAEFHVSKALSVVSHNPTNLRSLMVIHSADDTAVSIDQLTSFRQWVGKAHKPDQHVLELQFGEHFSSDAKLNLQITRKIDRFVDSLSR
jgi:predicted alpha/beta hydrolase